MSASQTLYTVRFSGPNYLERERTQVVTCPVYRDGVLAAPTSGTYTLYDGTNTVVVTSAVTISAGVATYTISSATLPSTLSLGTRWREEWLLTLADSTTRTIARDAVLVRRALYPTITLDDLARRHSDIGTLLEGSNDVYAQGYIDESWQIIANKLESTNRRPYLIIEPWALREVHVLKALELWCIDAHTTMTGDGKYLELADMYHAQFMREWGELRFAYDDDNDGAADTDDKTPAVPIVMLADPPPYYRGRSTRGAW